MCGKCVKCVFALSIACLVVPPRHALIATTTIPVLTAATLSFQLYAE